MPGFTSDEPPQAITLSRKELARLKLRPETLEAVALGVELTVLQLGRIVMPSLEPQIALCGKAIAALLTVGERPITIVPAEIERRGSDQMGCVVTMSTTGRVIVAWTEGSFKLSYHAVSIGCTTVREVERLPGKTGYAATLRVQTDTETWLIHFRQRAMGDGAIEGDDSVAVVADALQSREALDVRVRESAANATLGIADEVLDRWNVSTPAATAKATTADARSPRDTTAAPSIPALVAANPDSVCLRCGTGSDEGGWCAVCGLNLVPEAAYPRFSRVAQEREAAWIETNAGPRSQAMESRLSHESETVAQGPEPAEGAPSVHPDGFAVGAAAECPRCAIGYDESGWCGVCGLDLLPEATYPRFSAVAQAREAAWKQNASTGGSGD